MPATSPEDVRDEVLTLLEEAKAVDVRVYEVASRLPMAAYFVVATGAAGRHLEAMAETLRMRFKHLRRHAMEGVGETGWILYDLGDVVVHLFQEEARRKFGLDELWGRGTEAPSHG